MNTPTVSLDAGWIALTLFVSTLAGTITGRIVRGRGYGPMRDMMLGIVGGFMGTICLVLVLSTPVVGQLFVSVFGAMIFVLLTRLVRPNRD